MPRRLPLIRTYWERILFGIVVIAGIFALSFYSNKKLDRLKRERDAHGVFVIGTAIGEENDLKGTLVVEFSYSFAGATHIGSMATDRWLNVKPDAPRRNYYVRVAVADPGNAEILLDHPVPDGVVRSPDSGWVRIPGE